MPFDTQSPVTDICIIGAGMVGMSIAHQLRERYPALFITILDKEPSVGRHSSGRNSGVLHAGLYYIPGSLKARVCMAGAKRLRAWCEREELPVMSCGKLIVPQKPELDAHLELLLERGKANGVHVELIDEKQFLELAPSGRTSTGRAIWIPATSIVKPKLVLERLQQRLTEQGVRFCFSQTGCRPVPEEKKIGFKNGSTLSYGHLFNCAGLYSDTIAHAFSLGNSYTMLPFRGNYWQLSRDAPFQFNTNLYPVPDLNFPFLGIHVTPSVDEITYIGPTATPAFGRENYEGMKGADLLDSARISRYMLRQWLVDRKIRRYVREQATQGFSGQFLKAAKALIPDLEAKHIEKSGKVGIRPQLYDRDRHEFVQDFVLLQGRDSTHVINAISPAFTASFELADMILDQSVVNF